MTFLDSPFIRPSLELQSHVGWWQGDETTLKVDEDGILSLINKVDVPLMAVLKDGLVQLTDSGAVSFDLVKRPANAFPLLALVGPTSLDSLGDSSFCADYGLKYAYMGGSMAHGISSTKLAIELGKAGMIGFIGSAGDSPQKVEEHLLEMKASGVPFGFNLIHSPNEPDLENAIVDLYLKHEIRLIEASAFLGITLPLVRYRVSGIYEDEQGRVVTPNNVIAKVSRVEVGTRFFSPPPAKMLEQLVDSGVITARQAELAGRIPLAQDLTSESDSGGHTDNRPAVCIHPTMMALRNQMQAKFNYVKPLRVGFGGGIGTPSSAAAAFAMGAAYVVVGSIHQACVESGTSDVARLMLAQSGQADIAMAPAGDMFEMGVTVQVLKRGTMFPMRAQKLYEFYRKYNAIEEFSASDRNTLENTILRDSFENIWRGTREFFMVRDPKQVERAEADSHHKMALVFRWYLGLSSRWAISGDEDRRADYQIWCGPAMGSFNEWAKGSIYEEPKNRKAVHLAMNMLYGALKELRVSGLRTQGLVVAPEVATVSPMSLDEINALL